MDKKRFIKITGLALVLITAAGIFAACTNKVDAEITRNISELSTNIYTATTAQVEVTITTGERETPYIVDGVSEARSVYTIISVKPAVMTEEALPYDYVIKADRNEYRGKLNLHPFGITYTDTINKKTEGAVTVTLTSGNYSEEIAMNAQFTDKMIGWEDALAAGINSVKKEIETLYSGNKLLAEVFIRFTTDPLNENNEYFWYIAVVGNNGRTYGALINPLSGEVIATKKI